MTRSITAALHVVTSPGSPSTHLCASSPAIRGTRPDELPALTLCGRTTGLRAVTLPVAEVGCLTCLVSCTRYLELPSWQAGPCYPPTHPSK